MLWTRLGVSGGGFTLNTGPPRGFRSEFFVWGALAGSRQSNSNPHAHLDSSLPFLILALALIRAYFHPVNAYIQMRSVGVPKTSRPITIIATSVPTQAGSASQSQAKKNKEWPHKTVHSALESLVAHPKYFVTISRFSSYTLVF